MNRVRIPFILLLEVWEAIKSLLPQTGCMPQTITTSSGLIATRMKTKEGHYQFSDDTIISYVALYGLFTPSQKKKYLAPNAMHKKVHEAWEQDDTIEKHTIFT